MTQEQWTAVDGYVQDLFIPRDPTLEAVLQTSTAAGLPAINVSPLQGKLLQLLARMHEARTILEIGTLGGYSTIWLARALPADGRLVTLEVNPRYAEIARTNIARVGLTNVVDVRLGRALETLPQIAAENGGPFDLTFIDADKESTPEYFAWALRLSRPGSVIIVDNVVRNGAIVNADSNDPRVQGIRRFNELLAAETRVSATVIQTVGSKGYDGFALVLAL
jgi:predicted O-methyltransferase YrrM